MHYYSFNIADYRKDTTHLTPEEHYIYRTLIDWYFLDEAPIPNDNQLVCRRLLIKSEWLSHLYNVLNDFFEKTEKGWVHHRIEWDIKEYRRKIEACSEAGKLGGRPKKNQTLNKRKQTISESKGNQEPITNNHKPITNKNTTPLARLESLKVSKQIAKDWLALRNKLKAPVTETVINTFAKQAVIANISLEKALTICIENSWRGFQAIWLVNNHSLNPTNTNPHQIKLPNGKILDDWRESDDGIIAKGIELKVPITQYEKITDYRKRLFDAMGVRHG